MNVSFGLSVSPLAGGAPQRLTVGVNPNGLLTGTYTSSITVTAVGALNNPRVITVTLNIDAVVPRQIFLPIVLK